MNRRWRDTRLICERPHRPRRIRIDELQQHDDVLAPSLFMGAFGSIVTDREPHREPHSQMMLVIEPNSRSVTRSPKPGVAGSSPAGPVY